MTNEGTFLFYYPLGSVKASFQRYELVLGCRYCFPYCDTTSTESIHDERRGGLGAGGQLSRLVWPEKAITLS